MGKIYRELPIWHKVAKWPFITIFLYTFLERKLGDILAENKFSNAKQNKNLKSLFCFLVRGKGTQSGWSLESFMMLSNWLKKMFWGQKVRHSLNYRLGVSHFMYCLSIEICISCDQASSEEEEKGTWISNQVIFQTLPVTVTACRWQHRISVLKLRHIGESTQILPLKETQSQRC